MHFGSVVEIVSSALCKGARFSLNKIDFNIFKAEKIKMFANGLKKQNE